ncbi:MAG: hypothetical protein K0A98_04065 [Trueperaceae bacterium]|nr:hypothetical protein [Trueperaceae bacterium]
MTQHAGLSLDRWRRFDRGQQVLMIANEMLRTSRRMGHEDAGARRLGYERVLNLTDLTIVATDHRSFRRELWRWRDLAAELYLEATPRPDRHAQALRALLLLEVHAARQLTLLVA